MEDTGNSKSSFEPPPKQSSPENYIFVASSMGYTIKQYVSSPTNDDLPDSSSTTQKDRASSRTSTSPEEFPYLKARIYVDNSTSRGLSTGAKIAIGVGAAVLGGAATVLAAPLVLSGVGFTAGGVAAGSMAAAWQATIGNVVAGSLFSALQSAGVIGLGATGFAAAGAAGAAFLGIVGGIVVNGVKITIPVLKIQKTFDKYDSDKDGYVSADFLRNILQHLKVEMSDKELGEKFKKATGCEFNNFTPISYEEFLSIFGLKIYKNEELAGILETLYVKVVKEKEKVGTDDVKGMLKVLNVNASEKHVEACFVYVLGNQTGNITLQQFLKLFGVSKYYRGAIVRK